MPSEPNEPWKKIDANPAEWDRLSLEEQLAFLAEWATHGETNVNRKVRVRETIKSAIGFIAEQHEKARLANIPRLNWTRTGWRGQRPTDEEWEARVDGGALYATSRSGRCHWAFVSSRNERGHVTDNATGPCPVSVDEAKRLAEDWWARQ